MKNMWALQDAKARLSEVVRESAREPQHITLRGEEKAIVISPEEYRRLRKGRPDTTLYDIWKAAPKVEEFKIPKRKGRMRPVTF
jgi:antitoxin Phd